MGPPLRTDLRRRLYRRLAEHPGLVSFLRARRYDRPQFLREWFGRRNERQLLDQVRSGRDDRVAWTAGDAGWPTKQKVAQRA